MGRVLVFSFIKSNSCSRRLRPLATRNLRLLNICFTLVLSIFLVSSIGYAFENNIEKDFQGSLEQSRLIVEKVRAKLAASTSVSEEITLLKKTADDIRITHLLLQERFSLREEKARSLGSKAQERQRLMFEGYRQAIEEFLSIIDGIPPDGTIPQSAIRNLQSLLERILPKKRRPIIGSLPYKHLNYPAQEPSTTPEITPAYRGGNKTVSPDDTKSTPEAPISKEIAALAQSLNWQPVAIYEHVKNTIETDWGYWGCQKGAEETLRQKSGNDCDQSLLLASLLRAAGFPTRIVQSNIEFFAFDGRPIERVKNLTGIDDPLKIAEFFQKAGIPYKPIIEGGKIQNFEISHIYVESQIPYANYRGIVIDEHGKTWLGLDTTIKTEDYVYNNAKDIFQEPGVSSQLSAMRDEYLSALQTQTPLEYLQSRINSELTTQNSQLTYKDFLRSRTLPEEHMKILPDSMQFDEKRITGEYTEIPDELIHKVKITATNPQLATGNELFSITLPLYKLSNQQIAISYEPETVEDQEIINSYGGLDNTPSYLVRLRPVLKVNGERIVVAQDGLLMGSEYDLTIELRGAGGTDVTSSESRVEKITNTLIVGNLSVIGVVAQRAAAITPSPLAGEGGGEGAKDAERLLYEAANHYIDRWNKAEDELASLLHLSITRPLPTVVTVGGVIDVTYLLDMPHGFTWKGVYIDADLRTVETVASDELRVKNFMQLSSLQGSILENKIFEDDFQVQSISTAKLMTLANSSQVPILTIDATNIDSVLPTLSFGQNIKDEITNSVNQRLIVRIPSQELSYENWEGIGFIKENIETGESGWMLSGMIAGGMTAWGLDKWPAYYADLLSNPYSEPANSDPASARNIQKLSSTDLQKGEVGSVLSRSLMVKVTDQKGLAVKNVDVTFTVKAGGGKLLAFDPATATKTEKDTVVVKTSVTGVAEVDFRLGKETKANPTFWWDAGYMYPQQAGENIVDAALPSGEGLTKPFTAYGLPKQAHHMTPVHGDGTWGAALSFAGFVSVAVEDEYNNPVSNVPVTFTAADPTQNPDTPNCPWSAQDTRKAYLLETSTACLKDAPTWGTCGDTLKSSLTVTSNHTGAAAEVILGGMEDAIYTINASAPSNFNASFKLYTYDLYALYSRSCDNTEDPLRQLFVTYTYPTDQQGNSINAGKVGAIIPVQAKLYSLVEGETEKNVTIPCDSGGNLMCSKITGNRQYATTTDFVSSSVTFSGIAGTSQGSGVYTANYTLQPGLNTIAINGTASLSVRSTKMVCPSTCNTVTLTLIQTDATTLKVYGVDVKTQPLPLMFIDEKGYLEKEQTITYTIEPLNSDYKAMNAYVMIFKEGDIIASIPTETKGQGTATLTRGFQFDITSLYETQVILNYGTGVEIKGEKIKLPVAQVQVREDRAPYKIAEEIRYGRGNNSEKTYYIEIKSKALKDVCTSLTGNIQIIDRQGQPITVPPASGDDTYQADYQLKFTSPLLFGDCDVKTIDTLDGGDTKGKFIISNQSRNVLSEGWFNTNLWGKAVLYGGMGNRLRIEINGVKKVLPIEPVGVIVLGIDGLRQDVLYSPPGSNTDADASHSDPSGCGGQSCYVATDSLPGLSQILTNTGTVKLKDVTAIFPSITFASWASIFTGKLPKETGILGNEFFARDLYNPNTPNNQVIPGMETLPSGMVTLDADGGAFSPGGTLYALAHVMPVEFSIPGVYTLNGTLPEKLAASAPNNALMTEPLWSGIKDVVKTSYQVSTGRCDRSDYECSTVSMFNQYARGADWWGTPGTLSQDLFDYFKSWGDNAKVMDKAAVNEAESFITNYFSRLNPDRKRKRFPAVFSVYLSGLDHDAHGEGMGNYVNFFKTTTDPQVKEFVAALKNQDEFDNKIFIITADHGHTAMPTDLKYKRERTFVDADGGEYTVADYPPAETACKLKLDFQIDPNDPDEGKNKRKAEQANNNLHIWELGEVMRVVGKFTGGNFSYRVLAPEPIATLFSEEVYGARVALPDANLIAALNGPMAHIYVTNSAEISRVAEMFRLTMQGEYLPEAIKWFSVTEKGYKDLRSSIGKMNLKSSIDKILVRVSADANYCVFDGLNDDGSARCAVSDPFDAASYVDAWIRINGMNHKNRSGDIVLIMKDATIGNATDRYTTGVACKSWHGSLSPSDSYVPFILSYPGGNKAELEKILQKDTLCTTDYSGCKGNWKLSDMVKEIISEQYK